MDIEKTTRICDLLDTYQSLLTDKQKEIMDNYFSFDLSLSEIAENNKTTRSAVFDLIKRVCNTLEDYESKLHLVSKKECIEEIIKDLPKEIKDKIEEQL